MHDLGYIEGQNLRIELRSAQGHGERLAELAAELVREKVDVIAAWLTPAVLAAKRATNEIPIVMIGAADPVGVGLVASLARPGGNVTGMAGQIAELAGKHVELLKEVLPQLEKIGALCNALDLFSKTFLAHIERAGSAQTIVVEPFTIASEPELDAAFPTMIKRKVGAVIVQPSLPLRRAAELSLRHQIPAASPFVQEGGLLAYVAKGDLTRRAAVFVDKILKGTKPADLSVEQPNSVRVDHQYEDRDSARTDDPADTARACRPAD